MCENPEGISQEIRPFCMRSALSYVTRLLTQTGDAPLSLKTHCLVYFARVVSLICNNNKLMRTSSSAPDNLGHQGLADIPVSMLRRGDH